MALTQKSKINRQKLETVPCFKYLGSVITDEGSKPEMLSRIEQTTAASTRLKPVWNDMSISLGSKIRLMQRAVENGEKWRKLVANSSVESQRPSRLRDR